MWKVVVTKKCLPLNERKAGNDMGDRYRSFQEMADKEKEGKDFMRLVQHCPAPIVVVAPHGGGIEPGTSELAMAVAGDEFSYYCLVGLKGDDCWDLHVASTRMDDALLLDLLREKELAVAIHGCREHRPAVYVGGLESDLMTSILDSLQSAGVPALKERNHNRLGTHPANLCNRARSGRGVQLELTSGLRRKMFESLSMSGRSAPTPLFWKFAYAIRETLRGYWTEVIA